MRASSPHAIRHTPAAADRAAIARLDLARNPCALLLPVLDPADVGSPGPTLGGSELLRTRIGQVYGVSSRHLVLSGGASSTIFSLVTSLPGTQVLFAPSKLATYIADAVQFRDIFTVGRGNVRPNGFDFGIFCDLPADSVAVIDSPSDPLGSIAKAPDLVRLTRACRIVVIDERYAEIAGFSAMPLVAEFDNVIVVRSFENWAGIDAPAVGWVAASAPLVATVANSAVDPPAEALDLALAALGDTRHIAGTMRRLREERSRLYRLLRKFSFLAPVPSWGPFVSARVELTARDLLVTGLARRGVLVHAPPEEGLEQYVRIGIGTRSEMELLRTALLDLAPELIAGAVP